MLERWFFECSVKLALGHMAASINLYATFIKHECHEPTLRDLIIWRVRSDPQISSISW
uniref:Liver-related low express protein 1 n=1 Tax=Homo sapiens TaxID=9606 RepID=Q6SA06_HUMAN|nr:liver-related low express protein 1 [Homo sapiens]